MLPQINFLVITNFLKQFDILREINLIDERILLFLNSYALYLGQFANKLLAEYLIYLVPLTLLFLWFVFKKRKAALQAFFSAVLGWGVFANILGRFINRPRPFAGGGVREILFHRPTYSFPSDHATAFFAIAAAFYLSGNKKLAYVFFGLAIINSLFRIATGIHWPTDVLAGAVLGIFAAILINALDKYLDKFYEFIIKIAKKMRLA